MGLYMSVDVKEIKHKNVDWISLIQVECTNGLLWTVWWTLEGLLARKTDEPFELSSRLYVAGFESNFET